MTPPTPRHCAHECVCPEMTGVDRARKDPCDAKGTRAHCPHDTRTHPAPAAQSPPASSERKGYQTPDEPKASPRDFVFYRILAGIYEPELVTVEQASGAVHAYKRLAEMGYDPRKYDIMNIGKFSELPDDYEK